MHAWLLLSLLTAAPVPAATTTCESLSDAFCKELFSPEHGGNLDVPVGKALVAVRRGLTDNDMSDSARRALELRLTNRDRLPPELRAELDRLGYFQELGAYLHSDSWKKSTLEAGVQRRDRALSVPVLWTEGFRAAVFRSMASAHPGLAQTTPSEWPPLWNREESRRSQELLRETNEAVWSNAPEWQQAQRTFESVRNELKAWLHEQGGLSPAHAAAIEADLNTLKLYSPGTHPPASESCGTSVVNAMYNWQDNSVEICAGLLFSSSLPLVLAHEMGHVLGTDRQRQRSDQALAVYHLLAGLRERLCSGKPVDCVEWIVRRDRLGDQLQTRTPQPPEPLGFFQCLQDRPLEEAGPEAIRLEARERALGLVKGMASAGTFLKLTRPQTVSRTGAHFPNPAYLNPCQETEHFEDERLLEGRASAVLTFLAEYECSAPGGSGKAAAERLDRAIQETQKQAVFFAEQQLRARGTFGRDDWLIVKGFSRVVDEQEADFVGSEVTARLASRQPDLTARRNQTLLSLAMFCDEPSWYQESPDEVAVQSHYTARIHGFGAERRAGIVNAAASALQCQAPPPRCSWSTPIKAAAPVKPQASDSRPR